MNMKYSILPVIFLAAIKFCHGGPLRIQKRAAFYIANETACVVDSTVYSNGDPIPTDDPCESCKCRPPGFACVLKECEVKPGCRAVRRAGHCCPEYICGCEHNGRMYRDGDEIRDSQNPCYTCHCQGSSIACAFVDCFFRVDCAPEYVPGECCPHYTHCSSVALNSTAERDDSPFAFEKETTSPNPISPESTQQEELFQQSTSNAPYEDINEKVKTKDEPSKSEILKDENVELHFIYNRITEEPEIVDRDKEISLLTTTSLPVGDEKSNENEDSNESKKPEEEVATSENNSELVKVDSEVLKNEEDIEEQDISPVEGGPESSISFDDSTKSEATASNGNFEIFATEKIDTAAEESSAETTLVSFELEISDTKTETSATTKKEYEIETNNIEKRFRSLSNVTSEKDAELENGENKEKLEDGKSQDIALNEAVTTTILQDVSDASTSEEKIETSPPTPEARSSHDDSSEETAKEENHETNSNENQETDMKEIEIKENQETNIKEIDIKENQETEIKENRETKIKENDETDAKENDETDIKENTETDIKENQEANIKEYQESDITEKQETDIKENQDTANEDKTTVNLHYNAEQSSTFQSVETVTSVIEVKEQTSSSVEDNEKASSTASADAVLNLFRAPVEIVKSEENIVTEIQKDFPSSQKEEKQELSTESTDYSTTLSSASLADKVEIAEVQKATSVVEEKAEALTANSQTTESESSSTAITDEKDPVTEKIQTN